MIGETSPPLTPGATPPAFPGTAVPADATKPAPDPMGGIKPIGPDTSSAPLAPVEKAAQAPDAVNEVTPGSQPAAAQAPAAKGKKTAKPTYDKSDESSSKHKKKKGLGKLNPF